MILLHALRHATHQVVMGFCLDPSPHHLDVLDEYLLWSRLFHFVELLPDDRPEIFDRRKVGAVAWAFTLLPEAREVAAAPDLGLPGVM